MKRPPAPQGRRHFRKKRVKLIEELKSRGKTGRMASHLRLLWPKNLNIPPLPLPGKAAGPSKIRLPPNPLGTRRHLRPLKSAAKAAIADGSSRPWPCPPGRALSNHPAQSALLTGKVLPSADFM